MPTESVEINLPAPGFTLDTSAGRLIRLADYLGRPLVLYFIREFV